MTDATAKGNLTDVRNAVAAVTKGHFQGFDFLETTFRKPVADFFSFAW